MAHGIRCGMSKSDKKFCKCSCGGKLHGTQSGLSEFVEEDFKITINESVGGDVEDFIKSVKGKEFQCNCGNKIIVNKIYGFPNEVGLKDAEGEIWWIYVSCNKCEDDTSFWKVKNSVDTLKRNKKTIKKIKERTE